MSGKAQNVQANQGSWVTLSRRLRLRSSTQPTGETDLTTRKQISVKTRRGAPTCALSQVTCALPQVTCALPQGWRLEHNGNQGGFCCSVIGE
ncbi:hypothetical protein [Coleofasciculus sp. E2-BRE-01]|uniref:hypothetical protein n=1 Tax=Coleofasciculus sp. E2-BRE-01 TaxID=3069524 RepID=UPI0032F1906D